MITRILPLLVLSLTFLSSCANWDVERYGGGNNSVIQGPTISRTPPGGYAGEVFNYKALPNNYR